MDRPYEDPEDAVNEVRTPGNEPLPMFPVHLIPFYASTPVCFQRKQARLSGRAQAHT